MYHYFHICVVLCGQKYSKGMANIDIEGILKHQPDDGRVPKMKIVCSLGSTSRSVEMIE